MDKGSYDAPRFSLYVTFFHFVVINVHLLNTLINPSRQLKYLYDQPNSIDPSR